MESVLMRVSSEFKKWCEEMIKTKKIRTKDRNQQLSGARITELIPKHNNSEQIKEDILSFNWKNNKRGITYHLFYILAFALAGVIIMGIFGFLIHSMFNGLNQNVMVGQVNLSNVTEQTLGVVDRAYNNNLDLYGLFLIFGMFGGFFIASYMLRGKWDKFLIIVDILILIVVYIFAVMLSNFYESLLIASNGIITQFEGSMPKTSNFLLHLPRYVVIVGVIGMILFYSLIPKREGEKNINYQEGQY